MEHRIILTAAMSNWSDGDMHASIVIGGCRADGTPVETTIGLEMPPIECGEDLRQYARRALAALLGEL